MRKIKKLDRSVRRFEGKKKDLEMPFLEGNQTASSLDHTKREEFQFKGIYFEGFEVKPYLFIFKMNFFLILLLQVHPSCAIVYLNC